MLIKMDVTNAAQIENARYLIEDLVRDKGLNLLINNAGVYIRQSFPDTTEENMLLHFTTNTVAPVMVLKAMFPLLQQAASYTVGMNVCVSKAAVLNISSFGGSFQYKPNNFGREKLLGFSSQISKAALNMAMKNIARTVEGQDILIVNMCPGWVKTDMGRNAAELEVPESVSAMMNTLSLLNQSHHGAFIDRYGETIPY
ncbi:unnamed protein product [Larinioides sclopetarius]|uniref:C-factor n=1 Tax=Larinioides sclopetarius TaxID=280406 RepID=A0AAV2BXR6_9ARAC